MGRTLAPMDRHVKTRKNGASRRASCVEKDVSARTRTLIHNGRPMHRFLAACTLLFFLPFSVRAAGPTFISEVAWAGSSASLADEWLEICGAPGTDLSGWSIEGASASPIALPPGSAVPASGAYVIANYAGDDARSILAVAPDLVTTSVGLSNSDLFITLRDAGGAAVDVAGASDTAPFAGTSGETKSSMERSDSSIEGGVREAWASAAASIGFDSGANELGSPGACAAPGPDTLPTASATSGEEAPDEAEEAADPVPASPRVEPLSPVRVSELYPSPPVGEDEWLELVNPSAAGEFLDGWTIEDARGTKTPLEGLLLPWARVVIGSPKGSLNNDGDVVVLRDRLGRTVDRVEYPKTARGEAFMRVELQDTFVMTTTPTPGAANVLTEAESEPEEDAPMTPAPAEPTPAPPLSSSRPERSEAEGSIRPAIDPSTSLGMTTREDGKETGAVAVKPMAKKAAAKPKAAAKSRYKGDAYAATVVVPPGVYSKTRAYIQHEGTIEELRLSKGPTAAWNVGDRISFVAQAKSEGAVSFLLANPNSVRTIGSASASFAIAEAWPEEAGGYRFTAEVASIRGDALEVSLGGVEGDVLAPAGTAAALKPGDSVRVEGFIAPGPRPKVVLADAHALRLFKTRLPDGPGVVRKAKLPTALAIGLTAAAACVGLGAYLRMQRLKRLALTQAPVDPTSPGGFGGAGDGAWE